MEKIVTSPGNVGGADLHQTMEDINATMKAFIETANVDRVYGAPVEIGETKIIPAAENLVVMGFGAGGGYGSSASDDDEEAEESAEWSGEGAGGGGGGGGRTLTRPVAVVIASPEGVRIEPVADRTKVIMAAITAAGFVAGMFLRMTRGPKSF